MELSDDYSDLEIIETQIKPPSDDGSIFEMDVMVRARDGCTVAVRPEDEICRLRPVKDDDIDAVRRLGEAYRCRVADSTHKSGIGAASVLALAGEDNDSLRILSIKDRDPTDLSGYFVEPAVGGISAAKYKLAQRADEQARLFPELEKEIAERRKNLKAAVRNQGSKKYKD